MLVRPGVHHCKLKNVSWSLRPALAPCSVGQGGDVSYSMHTALQRSIKSCLGNPFGALESLYSQMQLFRTWYTKDETRHD